MKRVTLGDVQTSLAEYVKASATEPVLIIQGGKPVAMLVGVASPRKRVSIKLRDVLKRAWEDYAKVGGISHEQFWAELPADKP